MGLGLGLGLGARGELGPPLGRGVSSDRRWGEG
ncbi:hypothetical protein SAMN04515669_0779 [Jiangella sp. DSM 45060]|nr:hypothetical protein SAMN04515669_0779 [Jiangella sp. DSM 45060]